MAQACPSPAVTWTNGPAGGSEPWKLSSPQHSTFSFGRRPQLWALAAAPVATCTKAPDGGVDGSRPQQVTLPSVAASAQPWFQVMLRLLKAPAGGLASPSAFSPQQPSDPSSRMTQVASPLVAAGGSTVTTLYHVMDCSPSRVPTDITA